MKLSIKNNDRIFDMAEKVSEFKKDLIENIEEISEINLSGNILYPVFFTEIFLHLKKCKNLKTLHISRIFSTLPQTVMIEALDHLFEALPPTIEYIDISENALSWELPENFLKYLTENLNLKSLKINDCGLGIGGSKKIMNALDMKEDKGIFESIDISRNRITKGVVYIAEILCEFKNLSRIRIAYNTIERKHTEQFIEKIEQLKNLILFDIRDNLINENGMKILGRMFNKQLSTLLVGDCMIEDYGLIAFLSTFKNIKEKEGRKTLDLSYNDIEQEGIEVMTKHFENINNLSLYIFGNEYDDCSKLVGNIYKNNGVVHIEDVDDVYTHITIDELTEKVKEFF